jgi:hypothetical protein
MGVWNTMICLLMATYLCLGVPSKGQDLNKARETATSKSPQLISVAEMADFQVSVLEWQIVPAAEAMPEDKFNFAPTNGEFKGVRTFAQQIKHVANHNFRNFSLALDEKPPLDVSHNNGPDTIRTKAEIIEFLKDSYVLGHRAAKSLTPDNMGQVPRSLDPDNQDPRLDLVIFEVGHGFDHYGQMVEYLRMNGIVPPESARLTGH